MVLNGNKCPDALIKPDYIDANAQCDPGGRKHYDCDDQFTFPSTAWQACYQAISDCRKKYDVLNTKINKYNLRYHQCYPNR